MSIMTPHRSFDYATIDGSLANEARTAAKRIRDRAHQHVVDTGHDLIRIKEQLPHGSFGAWIAAEFDMSERTAQNFMNAARFLEGKSATVALLPPAAVYALAAPSAPPEVVNAVIAAVDAGERMPIADIRDRLSRAAAEQRKADTAKSREQIQKEREAEKRRRATQAERDVKLKQEQAAEEARREEQARHVARFLVTKLGGDGVVRLLKLLGDLDWYKVQCNFKSIKAGSFYVKDAAEIEREFGQGSAS